MWLWIHKFGSPKYFYNVSGKILPWVAGATALLIVIGLYLGLFASPADYQQRETVRIMYIHVPSAWNSMFIYLLMAASAAIGLIWNIKLADIVAAVSAPIGASFTFITLVTGSLWGKPMWGTWWEWDARLTSELILLFLYLGYIALQSAFEDRRLAARASAVLAIVGAVNVPIIYYSVQWWNTLHQPQSLGVGMSTIHPSMLWPLLIMALGFKLLYVVILLMRTRAEVLERERNNAWVQELAQALVGKSVIGSANEYR
ncbi:MAG: heme ABC transporter permease [Gammaproteobacteria bacterium]|nr:MAG: heme ABC transporter permease [Gammaproteobacteria bacterium]